MSYTTIKAVWPGEKHEDLEELRNSHGSAPIVWGEMSNRYIPGAGRYGWSFENEKLWPLWKRMDIPKPLRAVLTMTYDDAYIAKVNFKRAAADIRAFMVEFPQEPGRANHWPHIADLLDSDPDYPAIGFHWTSVCEDPFLGPYNEETEDYDPTDWSKKWEMYESLDALDTPQAA